MSWQPRKLQQCASNEVTQQTLNIKSWCQKVLDLLDLLFADHLDWIIRFTLNFHTTWGGNSDNHFFLQTRKKNSGQLMKSVDFMKYSRYFQRIYPSHANSETKKVHPVNFSTQAKIEEQHSECSSAALPSDYITRPVALVQHCSSRGAAQRSSRHAAAAGRLRSISLVCVLHNTITLTLTAVRTVKFLHSIGWMFTVH